MQLSRCDAQELRDSAASIVATPHRGDCSVSADLTADEIPATGGRHRFALENDTEFVSRLRISSDSVFERSLTFRFASLKLLYDRLPFGCLSIDLGM